MRDAVHGPATAPSAAQASRGPFSVVICNFDGEAHLPPCLDAVFALTPGALVDEVIVVDNASRDRSVELIERRFAARREQPAAPRLALERMRENRGPCPARNRGLELARNDWVLLLDNDAVCRPDVLARLADAARADPAAALVQPRSVFADDPGRVHYDGGSFHYVGLIALRNFYRPLAEAEGAGVTRVDCAVSVALLADRRALLELGGFDEGYFILFEDLDLSWRLRLAGRRILSVADALVEHRGGTAGISFRRGPRYPSSRVRLHSRNRWRFLTKALRVRTLLVALPGLALYELFGLAFAAASGGLAAWLGGKLDWLRDLPRTLELRRAVQRARTMPDRELLRGGPLTPTPDVLRSRARRALHAALDGALAAWWRLVRRAAG